MLELEDGTIFNHCFCYMEPKTTCDRSDCTNKGNKMKKQEIKIQHQEKKHQVKKVETYKDHKGQTRRRVLFSYSKPTKTQQNIRDEVCVKSIMRRYLKTGQLPQAKTPGFYGDFTGVDYHEMATKIAHANQQFQALPSEIRDRFGNNPEKLLNFVHDKKNRKEAIELGLIIPLETENLANQPQAPSQPQKMETPVKENKTQD